jgi:hypothetical protein
MQNKFVLLSCVLALAITRGSAQNVGINTDGLLPDSSAMLDIRSPNKGLLIPRISTAARLALPNTRGLLVFDTATAGFWYNSGSGWLNIATTTTPVSGSYWGLNGNDLGMDTTHFIGPISNSAFTVKVNSFLSGRIDPVHHNASWGYQAGAAGSQDTLGGTMKNYAGGNAAIGDYSLHSNIIGNSNTASGYAALYSNTVGSENTATGINALYSNNTGYFNTASGAAVLYYNVTGNENTATGYTALYLNTSGSYNVAYGEGALSNNNTGSYNTAVGSEANTALGSAGTNLTNATAIGYGATVNASNKIRLGNSAVTVIEGQVPFTTPSDGRFKYNVQENVKGLDFILKLRPVTYQFDVQRFDAQQRSTGAADAGYIMQASYDAAARVRRTGFIAQEVEKAAQSSGYDFSGIVKPATEADHYSLSYESFVVPLVKAVQEQQQIIRQQEKKLDAMQQEIDELKQLIRAGK